MADVIIVTTQSDTQNRFRDRSNYVWVDDDVGYYFQAIVGPTSQTMKGVEYYKTVNAGAAWTGPTDIWRNTGGTGRETDGWDIWYDRWTPDDTGTIIHVAVSTNISSTTSRQHKYFTLDTADDALTAVHAGFVSYSNSATGRSVSITKTEDGTLYFQTAFDVSATFPHNLWRSTDAGLNWTDLGSVVGIQGVRFVIFPTASSDDKDVLILVLDVIADSLKAYVWDDSISAFTSPVTLGTVGDFNHSNQGNFWSSTFRQSDKATLVAIHENGIHGSHDLRFFQVDWNGTTLTVTEKAKIFTAQTHGPGAAVTLDNNNDDIYVAYTEGTLGSTVVTQVKSTDGGATWSTPTQMSDEDVDYVSCWAAPQIIGLGRIHPLFERTIGGGDPDGETYQFVANTFILGFTAEGTLLRLEIDDYAPVLNSADPTINLVLLLKAHEWRELIGTKALILSIPGFEATPIALNYVDLLIQVKGVTERQHAPHPLLTGIGHSADFRDLEEATILFNKQVIPDDDSIPERRARLILPLLDGDRTYDGVIQGLTLVHNPGTDEVNFILKFLATWNPSTPALREWN